MAVTGYLRYGMVFGGTTMEESTTGLGTVQRQVRDFHIAMIGSTVAPPEPVAMTDYNGELRCSLIDEEAREFRAAWASRDRLGMIDALCDLLYVTLGAAVQMGIELEPFFDEVNRANMTKVGGSVREDGKQLKPPGWTPPDIAGTYRRLYGEFPAGEPEQQTLHLSAS
jgi:predicted HAD superfamily Cof-like phosphohydrolase